MRFNNETLKQYCSENNIELSNIYEQTKITRETRINGKCKTFGCNNNFDKSFRQLTITKDFCNECCVQKGIEKNKKRGVVWSSVSLYNYSCLNNIELLQDYTNKHVNKTTKIEGKCLNYGNCNNTFNKPFVQLKKTGGYCRECCKENIKEKIKETCLKKYGVNTVLKSKTIREHMKFCIKEKYGCEYMSQVEFVKNKRINTNINRYGVKYTLQNKNIRDKIIATNKNKYGCENPQQNKDIKAKTQDTNMKLYGSKQLFGSEIIKEKIKDTYVEKYGVMYPMQVPEISDKSLKSAYNQKKFLFPCGKVILCQGYEHHALQELVNEGYNSNDIITERFKVPELWWVDNNNISHRHFVDIWIPKNNKCIEVKSSWTLNKYGVIEKKNAAINNGYNYEIWVYNKKGIRETII